MRDGVLATLFDGLVSFISTSRMSKVMNKDTWDLVKEMTYPGLWPPSAGVLSDRYLASIYVSHCESVCHTQENFQIAVASSANLTPAICLGQANCPAMTSSNLLQPKV
jgi:hypothetical protein